MEHVSHVYTSKAIFNIIYCNLIAYVVSIYKIDAIEARIEPETPIHSRYGRMPIANVMSEPLIVTSNDSILATLNFKPYRSKVERRVIPFLPGPDEPQTMEINTPWGTQLTARRGDFLVSELDAPHDYWPIDPVIFEESYVIVRPGYCVKKAVTLLVPLTDLTGGKPDQLVTVVSLEGPETVRAGDFWLAKGIKGEIWPYPKEKIGNVMVSAE